MSAAVQTLWAETIAHALVDAGVRTVVISPGSRSTPLVAALLPLAARLDLVTIIDERAAAFFALGVARATGLPAALVCTSGTAAAHYLPAIIEAAQANVPLLAITADRPPELLACGASQTIDQVHMFGRFVRGAFDLGAPVASALALRSVQRKLVQAITLARGPLPGPVHVEVPLRKPLEPVLPTTPEELALADAARALRGPIAIAPPRLAPDGAALAELAQAIERETDGVIVVGALTTPVPGLVELAARAGYPLLVEAGSQLPGLRIDLVPIAQRPTPRLVIQLGAEPVAASWQHWDLSRAERFVLGESWADPAQSARVILGDPQLAQLGISARSGVRTAAWLDTWRDLAARAERAVDAAIAQHPNNEVAVLRAALAASECTVQLGNSLPIRTVDHVLRTQRRVLTQRGAAGIDGLIASAAGATRAGAVLLVLGDVSFTHDLGALVAARAAAAPLAILVIDNRGGQIFAGLPVAKAGLSLDAWLTPPDVDVVAVATALGARAIAATTPDAVAAATRTALAGTGVTVIHAPVSASGAHDVRRTAIALMEEANDHAQPTRTTRPDARPDVDQPPGLRGHPVPDVP